MHHFAFRWVSIAQEDGGILAEKLMQAVGHQASSLAAYALSGSCQLRLIATIQKLSRSSLEYANEPTALRSWDTACKRCAAEIVSPRLQFPRGCP